MSGEIRQHAQGQDGKGCLEGTFDMDPRIKLALQVMCRTRVRDVTVADVAEEVGLSASRFEHILKEATGHTFKQHARRIRVRQAKTLLQDWHLSLKQIAYLTGYSSPSSFSRAFRNCVRRSPSQYRMTIVS
jgi:transcriptional regulator GlxA family with amidase domain